LYQCHEAQTYMSKDRKGVKLKEFFDKGNNTKPDIKPSPTNVQKSPIKVKKEVVHTKPPLEKKVIQKTPTRAENSFIKSAEGLRKKNTYEEFIYWIATPDHMRDPATQKLFAEKWHVGEDTLTDWKRRDGFYDEVRKNVRIYGRDRLALCVTALINNIMKKGNGQDFKAFVEYIDEFNPKLRLSDETPVFGELSDTARADLIKSLKLTGLSSLVKLAEDKKEEFNKSEDEPKQ
jgi:hypothetical protein